MDAFTQRFSDLEEEVLHSKREPEETEGLKEDVQKQQNAIKSNVSWLEFELLLEKLRSEVFLVAVQRAQAAFCNARLSSVGIDSWLGWIPILVFMKTIDFSCALDVFFGTSLIFNLATGQVRSLQIQMEGLEQLRKARDPPIVTSHHPGFNLVTPPHLKRNMMKYVQILAAQFVGPVPNIYDLECLQGS